MRPYYEDERGEFGNSAWRYNCGNCKESRALGPPLNGPKNEMRRCMVFALQVLNYDKACLSWEPRKVVEARRADAEQGVLL